MSESEDSDIDDLGDEWAHARPLLDQQASLSHSRPPASTPQPLSATVAQDFVDHKDLDEWELVKDDPVVKRVCMANDGERANLAEVLRLKKYESFCF